MTNWTEKIADVAEREEAARLCLARLAAYQVMIDAENAYVELSDNQMRQIADEEDAHRAAIRALEAAHHARIDAIRGDNPAVTAARTAYEAADQAYNDHPSPAIMADIHDEVVRCALSGVPVYDDDAIVEYGDHIILASLILPDHLLGDDGEGEAD